MHKIAGGGKEWYRIRRLKCTDDKCRKLHNELPDCIFPYKHYDAGLIEDVVDGVVSEDDIETEDYPCEGTIKHWKWWMQMNEKNVEGQMRSAAHRFLDFIVGQQALSFCRSAIPDKGCNLCNPTFRNRGF